MEGPAALIGIDWGTTSFRAWRIDATGNLLETRAAAAGILRVPGSAFEAALEREIGDWLEAGPQPPLIASGMITSRQGWVEVPYCPCPAGSAEIAHGLVSHRTGKARKIHFVPGLSLVGDDGVPDVMRGEETQILGELGESREPRLMVLPGTHSKWALAQNGRIVWFATFMTGEVYGVLVQHSILGRMMQGEAQDEPAFLQGVAYARTGGGGVLKKLFSARTLGLLERLPGEAVGSYLSGLLIGAEIAGAIECVAASGAMAEITVIGESALAERYRVALDAAGLPARSGADQASARGHVVIARAAGLLP
jgi:2-dehydro-3-deoxygalactonokinase